MALWSQAFDVEEYPMFEDLVQCVRLNELVDRVMGRTSQVEGHPRAQQSPPRRQHPHAAIDVDMDDSPPARKKQRRSIQETPPEPSGARWLDSLSAIADDAAPSVARHSNQYSNRDSPDEEQKDGRVGAPAFDDDDEPFTIRTRRPIVCRSKLKKQRDVDEEVVDVDEDAFQLPRDEWVFHTPPRQTLTRDARCSPAGATRAYVPAMLMEATPPSGDGRRLVLELDDRYRPVEYVWTDSRQLYLLQNVAPFEGHVDAACPPSAGDPSNSQTAADVSPLDYLSLDCDMPEF